MPSILVCLISCQAGRARYHDACGELGKETFQQINLEARSGLWSLERTWSCISCLISLQRQLGACKGLPHIHTWSPLLNLVAQGTLRQKWKSMSSTTWLEHSETTLKHAESISTYKGPDATRGGIVGCLMFKPLRLMVCMGAEVVCELARSCLEVSGKVVPDFWVFSQTHRQNPHFILSTGAVAVWSAAEDQHFHDDVNSHSHDNHKQYQDEQLRNARGSCRAVCPKNPFPCCILAQICNPSCLFQTCCFSDSQVRPCSSLCCCCQKRRERPSTAALLGLRTPEKRVPGPYRPPFTDAFMLKALCFGS